MNIYELEKLANPTPWEATTPNAVHESRVYVPCKRVVTQLINKHDAKLLAHCRNHFIEALEALKEYEETFGCLCMKELITKLETL